MSFLFKYIYCYFPNIEKLNKNYAGWFYIQIFCGKFTSLVFNHQASFHQDKDACMLYAKRKFKHRLHTSYFKQELKESVCTLPFSDPPDLVKSRQAKISKLEHAIYATYPRPLPECPPRGVNPRQPPISIYCYYYLPILTYIVISL